MRSSSERIGALAAALAKAQSEITNPEKSLTATILSPFPREGRRTFRYASLSTGLDLVRKCLGQHEIATVQATAIDRDRDLIRLTTTLVDSSGEGVSSDWPVCPVSEPAAPHRLGAALTYARRYALFPLVGIAGEDDLDAPDLNPLIKSDPSQSTSPAPGERANGHDAAVSPRAGRKTPPPRAPVLAEKESRQMRDRLTAEVEAFQSADEAAIWAKGGLVVKNSLSKTDADTVERIFRIKLADLAEKRSVDETTQDPQETS